MKTAQLFDTFGIEDRAIRDLKPIGSFTYFDPEDPNLFITFLRNTFELYSDVIWTARLHNKKGYTQRTRNVTAMFVSDFLNSHREHVGITYRS
jgi:hypothetical protein